MDAVTHLAPTVGVLAALGGLVLLVGTMILVGSVSMTRFQRIYEAAIFRTLGAGTRLLTVKESPAEPPNLYLRADAADRAGSGKPLGERPSGERAAGEWITPPAWPRARGALR